MIEYTVKVYDDQTKWFLNGKYHREDGPAITWDNGTKYWYIEGKELTEKEFLQRSKPCSGKKVTVDGIDYELV